MPEVVELVETCLPLPLELQWSSNADWLLPEPPMTPTSKILISPHTAQMCNAHTNDVLGRHASWIDVLKVAGK